jgi:hypothetical protein
MDGTSRTSLLLRTRTSEAGSLWNCSRPIRSAFFRSLGPPQTLPMPIKCPPAPVAANPTLFIRSSILKAGNVLTRFHSKVRAGNIYNPNKNKRIGVEEDGARFNPFPGAPATNVPTLYAADNPSAAALESIFHGLKHIPSPTFPRLGLKESCYSQLTVNDDLLVIELVNPQLRQLAVAGRRASLSEGELIHSRPRQYKAA